MPVLGLIVGALTVGVTPEPASAAAGGPVILDGTDLGFHGNYNGTDVQSTWFYNKVAYSTLLANVPGSYANNGKIAVVGAADSTADRNDCGAAAHWSAFKLNLTVDYFEGAAAISALFDGVRNGTSNYKLIQIVDGLYCGNRMDSAEEAVVNQSGDAIAAHVNRGGALFAQAHSYSWLTSLFPTIQVDNCSGLNPILTAEGSANFPSLSNSDINAAYHKCFSDTSGTLPLPVLANEGSNVVIIGGASVQLPGAVTATPSSMRVAPGSNACFVVNVKRGTPLANLDGATVTFSATGTNAALSIASVSTSATGNTPNTCYTSATTGSDTINVEAFFDEDSDPSTAEVSQGTTSVSVTWVYPITAPTITSLTGTSGGLSVAFTAPSSDGGSTITNYKYQVDGGAWVALSPVSTSSPFTISGLTDGTAYSIKLRAVNGDGDGPESTPVSGNAGQFPSAPLNVTATPGITWVDLSWSPPSTPGGGPVLSYLVTSSPGGATCSVEAPETSCTVSGLSQDFTYTFTVVARNVIGVGPSGSTSAKTLFAGPLGVVPSPSTVPPTSTIPPSTTLAPVRPNPPSPVTVAPGEVPSVSRGESQATENGVPVPITVELVDVGQWQMTGQDFQLSMEIPAGDTPGSAGGVVTLVRDREVNVDGFGFEPNTYVDVWLFRASSVAPQSRSDGRIVAQEAVLYLGSVLVNADGTFAGPLPVPASLDEGEYTLQANGKSFDGLERSLNLGVQVLSTSFELPVTGGRADLGAVMGWLLIVAGLLLVAIRRRSFSAS